MNKEAGSSFVFTTEGHLLPLVSTASPPDITPPARPMYSTNHTLLDLDPLITTTPHFNLRDKLQCPVYRYSGLSLLKNGGLTRSIRERPDFEYARMLAGISTSADRVLGVGFPKAKGYDTVNT